MRHQHLDVKMNGCIPLSASLPFPSCFLYTQKYEISVPLHATETPKCTPYVDAVSTDEDRGGIWILLHGLRHAFFKVFLMGSILDNWNLQSVKVRKRILHAAYTHALDHLNLEKFNIRCAADNEPH